MPVPNTFANATTSIPLSQLDTNFATAITLGNTAIQLGNTVSTLNNMTLANVTISSGTVSVANATVTGNVTMSGGNLSFTSTGQRITGDFSNATAANRVAFQSSTTNGNTLIGAIPNGTGLNADFRSFNNSDTTNAAFFQLGIANSGTEARLNSGITGTGTYLPMTFVTGGSERMRLDTSGNVGIGTSSPVGRFASVGGSIQLSGGTTSQAGLRVQYASSVATITGINNDNNAFNPLAFYTGASEAMRIDTSGNLLVGPTSTARGAQFRITGEALLPSILLGATTSNIYIYEGSTNVISFRTGASGSDRYFSFDTSGNGNALNGSWVNGSDIRLKGNVKNLNKGLAEVLSLRPVSYNRIGVLKTEIGFIAQEVQAIAPEIVHDAGEYLGISYGNLNALLVAAIQELSVKVAALEAKQ